MSSSVIAAMLSMTFVMELTAPSLAHAGSCNIFREVNKAFEQHVRRTIGETPPPTNAKHSRKVIQDAKLKSTKLLVRNGVRFHEDPEVPSAFFAREKKYGTGHSSDDFFGPIPEGGIQSDAHILIVDSVTGKGPRAENTPALLHPDMPKYLRRMREKGYRLAVDPTYSLVKIGGSYDLNNHLIRLADNASWGTFRHEFQHLLQDEVFQKMDWDEMKSIAHLSPPIFHSAMRARVGIIDPELDLGSLRTMGHRGLNYLAGIETGAVDVQIQMLNASGYNIWSTERRFARNYALRYQLKSLAFDHTQPSEAKRALYFASIYLEKILSDQDLLVLVLGVPAAAVNAWYSYKDRRQSTKARHEKPAPQPNSVACNPKLRRCVVLYENGMKLEIDMTRLPNAKDS